MQLNRIQGVFFVLLFGVLQSTTIVAQQSANTAGGDASGPGGHSSYSLGQVVYQSLISSVGSMTEGVQQPQTTPTCPKIIATETTGCTGGTLPPMTVDVSGGTWSIISSIGSAVDQNGTVILGAGQEGVEDQDTVTYTVGGCTDTVVVTSSLSGTYCLCEVTDLSVSGILPSDTFQAQGILESAGTVSRDSAVVFRAGQKIVLHPGFIATSGSNFLAYIGLCEAPDTYQPQPVVEGREEAVESSHTPNVSRIWPNPFHGMFTVEVNLREASDLSLYLQHIHGGQVRQLLAARDVEKGVYQYTIRQPNLAAGVYVVIVQAGAWREAHQIVRVE